MMIVKPARRLDRVEEYYFSVKLKQIREMNLRGMQVLNLGIGSPDLDPAAEVLAVLAKEGSRSGNHAYQSYRGLPELRQAFAKWYSRHFGVSLHAETEVLPLMGSKEGLMHLAMSFLEEGDKALVPNPAYPAYAAVSRLAGAEVVYYDLKEENAWRPDFSSLEQMDLSEVKIMWLNYPNMPTGARASRALFESWIAFAERHKILLVHDNPYAFILSQPFSILSLPGAKQVALELNSLSKSHNMAGWRVGVLTGSASYLQEVLKFKSNMDSGMFKPLQLAAVRALKLGASWYERQNAVYAERRQRVFELLDLLGCTYDRAGSGLFVWAKIPDAWLDAEELSEHLLHTARIFITPGHIFGSRGKRYLRISLCLEKEVLSEALRRIRELVPVGK